MTMSLSLCPVVEMRHSVQMALKAEMRQEMRLVLQQLLKLLQKLELALRLDLKAVLKLSDVTRLSKAIVGVEDEELVTVARDLTDRHSVDEVEELAWVIWAAAGRDQVANAELGRLHTALEHELAQERARHHGEEDGLLGGGIRLLFQPPFWGSSCVPGTHGNLATLLRLVPQRHRNGRPVWALAGGLAVELLTGVIRDHHDIDALILGGKPTFVDTDVVETRDYFGMISTSREFARYHCTTLVPWEYGGEKFLVLVLRPEYLFVSKFVSGHPRPQDWADIGSLVRAFSATWSIGLIQQLLRRNRCSFKRTQELLQLLQSKSKRSAVEETLVALRAFYE